MRSTKDIRGSHRAAAHRGLCHRAKTRCDGEIKRWLKRRAMVEPVISHAKNDGLLGCNRPRGHASDRCNALLVASSFNLLQLLRFLRRSKPSLSLFLEALLADFVPCGSLLSQEAAHPILTAQNYSVLCPRNRILNGGLQTRSRALLGQRAQSCFLFSVLN